LDGGASPPSDLSAQHLQPRLWRYVPNCTAEDASAPRCARPHAAGPGRAAAVLAVWGALAILAGCATTHAPGPRPPRSGAAPPAPHGPLAALEARFHTAHPESKSGFVLLEKNEAALRARIALADAAVRSLDLQYYIWSGDASGDLLMKHVVDAADRGVHVRLILDDISSLMKNKSREESRDSALAKVNAHPNIQVRLFNASHSRSTLARGLEFLTHSEQLDQRMHNKVMIADNRAMIAGGRNIGDEYFGTSAHSNFLDLDVLGVGEVAQQASVVFDRFWNSEWVTPVGELKRGATPQDLEAETAQVRDQLQSDESMEHFALDREDSPLRGLLAALQPGASQMLSDKLDEDAVEHQMATAVRGFMGSAQRELLIINAYVIPDDALLASLRSLTDRGVRIRLLTNSLASLDETAVNSHYKSWRKRLLEAGVELYEMRADAEVQGILVDTPPTHAAFMGLHTKAMVVDREAVFVGSMNLDPRSSSLNSEMGVIIRSASLAGELAEVTEREMLPTNAWKISLDAHGELAWSDARETVHRQPARSTWQRVESDFFMLVPKSEY
jgi:putative cardiolipin synthase